VDARDGKTVRKLSDYRGKAVVLNWYASWCGPCKREIPELQRVWEQLGAELVVLGVDPLESQSKAAGILNELNATFPAVLDSSGEVTDHYRVGKGLPKTYFIDKDGVLRGVKTGEIRPQELVKFLGAMGITYIPE
jgi:peroxiredoxin